MSNSTQEPAEMGTKPRAEHEWLKKLLGNWRVVSEMTMGPDQPAMTAQGTETVESMGGLWACGSGKTTIPGGATMEYRTALGYDVSFNQYRGCRFASASSHLWKFEGDLSADGRVMTLNCVGPDMVHDGKTANYRDVIEIIDDNHWTLTSYGEDENGVYQQHMKSTYTRA